jgi:hypothetical protein
MSSTLKNDDMACPACGAHDWVSAGRVKDFSISGEWFELKMCTSCQLKVTDPQPSTTEIGRYYASADYVSHSDTKSGLINQLYHTARTFI